MLLTGCAAIPLAGIQIGQYAPGRYLANVEFRDDAEVRDVCQHERAWACTRIEWIDVTATYGSFVGEIWQVFRSTLGVKFETRYGAVHELCHAIADLQLAVIVVDPCHNEDSGILPAP